MDEKQLQQICRTIRYDPDAGTLIWLVDRPRAKAGTAAGSVGGKGYVTLGVCGARFRAHRLAVILMTGKNPEGEVDHINGRRDDNRWSNLRVCTSSENSQNQRVARPDNRSCGLLGVTWSKQRLKWRARITLRGKTTELGFFSAARDAHEAYLIAKRAMHPACTI